VRIWREECTFFCDVLSGKSSGRDGTTFAVVQWRRSQRLSARRNRLLRGRSDCVSNSLEMIITHGFTIFETRCRS